MRRISMTICAFALLSALLVGSATFLSSASAHPAHVQSCGYTVVNQNSGDGITVKLWNYTCSNQAHVQVISSHSGCQEMYAALTNNLIGQTTTGAGWMCYGDNFNTGVVAFNSGWMGGYGQRDGSTTRISVHA